MHPSCVHYAWLKWSRSGIQTLLVGVNFHSWTWPKKGSWIVVVSLTGLGMSHMMRTSSCLVNTFVPLTQLLNSFNTCPWHLQIWKILPLGHMSQRSLPWLFFWKQQLHAILIIAAVSWKIIRAGLCMLLRPVGTASPTQSFFLLTLISFTLSQSVVTKLRKFHYVTPPPPITFSSFSFREGATNKFLTSPGGELGANLLLKIKLEKESPVKASTLSQNTAAMETDTWVSFMFVLNGIFMFVDCPTFISQLDRAQTFATQYGRVLCTIPVFASCTVSNRSGWG